MTHLRTRDLERKDRKTERPTSQTLAMPQMSASQLSLQLTESPFEVPTAYMAIVEKASDAQALLPPHVKNEIIAIVDYHLLISIRGSRQVTLQVTVTVQLTWHQRRMSKSTCKAY